MNENSRRMRARKLPRSRKAAPAANTKTTRPTSLPRAIRQDLTTILTGWSKYMQKLQSEAFAFLVVLEGIKLSGGSEPRFNYRELEKAMNVSSSTLRRWLGALKKAGIVDTQFVPGTNRAEATFDINLSGGSSRGR